MNGETYIIVDCSTKKYPTKLKDYFEMHHFKSAPKPASLILLSSGLLNMSQIAGAAPFPFPNPWGGGLMGVAYIFPPDLVGESPNVVMMEWYMCCSVVRVHRIGCFDMLTI